jgi:alpha-tubulin suppressor-like RCC1 family protein
MINRILMLGVLLTTLLCLSACQETYDLTQGSVAAVDIPTPFTVKTNRLSGTYSSSTHFLHPDGRLFSWGGNWDGQLGNFPLTAASRVPVPVNLTHLGLSNEFKNLATSGYYNYHMCAVHASGKVLCWGSNYTGECGIGNDTDLCNKPTEILMNHLPEANDFLMVSVGQERTCGLHANQKIFCWGKNSTGGELGTGDTTNHFVATEVDMSVAAVTNKFKYVSVSETNSCGIHDNGKIYCWGWNDSGQLGIGTSGPGLKSLSPIEINMSAHPEGNNFVAVGAGYHSCGIHANGKLFCWGGNSNGELGIGPLPNQSLPIAVDMSLTFKLNSFTAIEISSSNTCAIHLDKSVYCWGDNGYSAISGSALPEDRPFPYDMSSQAVSNSFTQVSTDNEGWTICGLHINDKLYCSGRNSSGQLGNNSIIDSPTPVEVDMSSM